ncbi:2'-5' RNA ligase [Gemmobacter aquatilis]|uniref:RNA 2',3'-cyclic phosphodiesterase n=1 Tax=Gemmobacter aquatilis TaxID=933059 RepID=A0A1H8DHV7_9RHOB|nr:RNA 2',3'-cyclic phosphodiesterase [Gemmobacter aquatilis]SEN06869.1 2'-5' RNA ligase [Gemmobacter aquatilis]
MIRAFVGIAMPEEVTARLRLLQFLLPLPRRTEPEDFHLTLAFLGEQPDPVLEAVHEGLEALVIAPFALELRGVGLFGGAKPRIAWAGVAANPALIHLQAKVARIAVAAGVPVAARDFAPHVTLGRFPPPDPEAALRLEQAVVAEQGFHAGPWLVPDIRLYASHSGGKGPRYESLAAYPLA